MSDNTIPSVDNSSAIPIVTGLTNTVKNSQLTGSTARNAKPWKARDELLRFISIWENGVENGKNFAKQTVTNGFILTVL